MSEIGPEPAANRAPVVPETYRNVRLVVPAGTMFVCLGLLCTWLAARHWRYPDHGSWNTMVFVAIALFCMAAAVRLLSLGLTFTDEGLTVRNVFRTLHLRWSEVEAFRIEWTMDGPYGPSESWSLVLDLRGYDPVEVTAVGGRRYLQRIYPELEAARRRLGSRGGGARTGTPAAGKHHGGRRARGRAPTLPVTYRSLWFVVSGVGFGYAALVFGWLTVGEWSDPYLGFWERVFLYPLGPVCAFLSIRVSRLGVKVTESELVVRNVFRTRRLPWDEIRGFRVLEETIVTGAGPAPGWSLFVLMEPFDIVRVSGIGGRRAAPRTCSELERWRRRLGRPTAHSTRRHERLVGGR